MNDVEAEQREAVRSDELIRFFSVLSHDLTGPGSPRITRGPSFFDDPEALINKEGEDHLRIRRIVASAFTPRRVETWKPTIRAVAAELLDALERSGPPAEVMGLAAGAT